MSSGLGPDPTWTCSKCGEMNEGSLEVCWNCGSSNTIAVDPSSQRESAFGATDVAERGKHSRPKSTLHLVIQGLGGVGFFCLGLTYTMSELRRDSPGMVAVVAGGIVLACGIVATIGAIVESRKSRND